MNQNNHVCWWLLDLNTLRPPCVSGAFLSRWSLWSLKAAEQYAETRASHRGRSNELRILSSFRGPSLAAHSASHSASSCPSPLRGLHGITDSTVYISSTHSSTFSRLLSGFPSFFIRCWMNVCCRVWSSVHDWSWWRWAKCTHTKRGTFLNLHCLYSSYFCYNFVPFYCSSIFYSTCKKCDKEWASLGFFFSNKVRRQDSTAASVVLEPSGAFCSDCASKKAWCNSCRKIIISGLNYVSTCTTVEQSVSIKEAKKLSYHVFTTWSTTDKSQNNINLENSLWYALWPQLLQEQQELQLSSDVRRNLRGSTEILFHSVVIQRHNIVIVVPRKICVLYLTQTKVVSNTNMQVEASRLKPVALS